MLKLIFLVFIALSCKKLSSVAPSEPLNNGPVADLSTEQARASGLFVFRLHPVLLKKLWDSQSRKIDPKCENQANVNGSNLEQCGYSFACSGVIARDPVFPQKAVVLSAAHCNLNQAYEGLVNLVSDKLDTKSRAAIAASKMNSAFEKNFQGKARLWFYVPASKQWLEIDRFIPHPSFVELLSARDESFDVAIASFTPAALQQVKSSVEVEHSASAVEPKEKNLVEKLYDLQNPSKSQIENKSPSDFKDATDKYGFSLNLFDNNPLTEAFGFGVLNAFSLAKEVKGITESQCRNNENFYYFPKERRCFELDIKTTENQLLPLRSVHLRIALLDTKNHNMILIPSSSAPKEGVCYGDSGGPVFHSKSSKLLAVVSGGELPCAGGVSMATLVSPHLAELSAALANPRQ